ncbi:MAG: acyltransferase family protein [Bacteroidota bacterium]
MAIRNQTADTLKGLAVIFMIQVHIMEQFASVETSNSMFGKLAYFLGGPFCAPVFIAVMGYFLASSKQSFSYFIKRGLILFLAGILLNIGRSFHLFITIFQGKYNLDPMFFIFGVDILSLAGLSIILLAFLRLISKKNLLLYIPLILFFAGLDDFVVVNSQTHGFFFAYIIGDFDHSYFPLFPWFSYVLSGYVFKIIYDKYHHLLHPFSYIQWIFVSVLSVVILFFSPYTFAISNDLDVYYHHSFYFFLWTIGSMMLYVLLINSICKALGNTLLMGYLSWTGRNVTLIYLIQWLIIGNIATAIYLTQNLWQSELWFIGITSLTCAIAFVYLKIKESNKSEKENLI